MELKDETLEKLTSLIVAIEHVLAAVLMGLLVGYFGPIIASAVTLVSILHWGWIWFNNKKTYISSSIVLIGWVFWMNVIILITAWCYVL
jgi:hypothetical protein